jgi:MoaA/NifB/PqqE/SkfB family radical SAM enzyme
MSTDVILDTLDKLKKHNPEIFHIFYGGEPLLRKDLSTIINYCNDNNILYTIISNNTYEIQPLINKLFKEVDYIQGFTGSIDYIITSKNKLQNDIVKKSFQSFQNLKKIKQISKVKDVVAEITVTNKNIKYLYQIIETLTKANIYSSITFVDIAKNPYYDFSNILSKNKLIKQNLKLYNIFQKLYNNNNLLIHMKELLPKIFNILPSNYDCKLEDGIHNITIDADGNMRLCLRIRGLLSPTIHISNLFENNSYEKISTKFYNLLCIDKQKFCKLCNHTCLIMSQAVNNNNKIDNLIHSKIRGNKNGNFK